MILPLDQRVDTTLLTLLSLTESTRGYPLEFLLLRRPESGVDESLIRGGNFEVIDTRECEFGPALNKAALSVRKDSEGLLFITPGTILLRFPYSEILEKAKEAPIDVFAFRTSVLRNPVTKATQRYPSWMAMFVSPQGFKEVGGFSEYLPLVGGDLLYCLEASRKDGKMIHLPESSRVVSQYSIADSNSMEIHDRLLYKRLPMLMKSKGLGGDVMAGWPGIKIQKAE